MFVATLLLALAVAPEGPPLPPRMGAFLRDDIAPQPLAPGERKLFAEYRFVAAHRAEYVDEHARRMIVEAFRFADAEGAHAAYLCSRPAGGVSPQIWAIDAMTVDGITVMEFHNYVLHFRGALPSISSELEEMLAALPGLAAERAPWDLTGRYLNHLSTRMILGPVSLNRFAKRIPPSVAGLRLGAKGRLARFETPAAPMTAIVFEYPTDEIARDQAKALAGLPGSFVRVDRTCAGVILDAGDTKIAEELMSNTYFCGPVTVEWDPNTVWDGPMTLSQGVGGVAFWGLIVGGAAAGLRRSQRSIEPFPNRMIFLKL